MHVIRAFLLPFILVAAFIVGCALFDVGVSLASGGELFTWQAASWVVTFIATHLADTLRALGVAGIALAMTAFALAGDVVADKP